MRVFAKTFYDQTRNQDPGLCANFEQFLGRIMGSFATIVNPLVPGVHLKVTHF